MKEFTKAYDSITFENLKEMLIYNWSTQEK